MTINARSDRRFCVEIKTRNFTATATRPKPPPPISVKPGGVISTLHQTQIFRFLPVEVNFQVENVNAILTREEKARRVSGCEASSYNDILCALLDQIRGA